MKVKLLSGLTDCKEIADSLGMTLKDFMDIAQVIDKNSPAYKLLTELRCYENS
jgi:hypothetical protein